MRYGCQKISSCSEDSIKVGKEGNTWNMDMSKATQNSQRPDFGCSKF